MRTRPNPPHQADFRRRGGPRGRPREAATRTRPNLPHQADFRRRGGPRGRPQAAAMRTRPNPPHQADFRRRGGLGSGLALSLPAALRLRQGKCLPNCFGRLTPPGCR